MLTHLQRLRVQKLSAHDYGANDIAALTGYDVDEIRGEIATEPLADTYRRLMSRVPAWWRGDEASYRRVVFMNFSDVA